METAYKAISFAKHDIVTRPVLNQLNANLRWIEENTPRGRHYGDEGDPRPENIVLIAGKKEIPQHKKNDSAIVKVSFGGDVFSAKCNPTVTTSVVADFQRKIFCAVRGPQGAPYPNSNGFQISVNIASETKKHDIIKKNFFVHWHALGFRMDDINEF